MPFIPHTRTDVAAMLEAIGVPSIDALFDEIPASLLCDGLPGVPERVGEMEISRLMHERAAQDGQLLNFVGAGAYEHHIPAAVWEITTRGEFYSAYTPYQAEASQGTLQLLYEFQSMMTALTGMDASNASLYDGASALAEALLMAVRANPKEGPARVLMPRAVHPFYRQAVEAITSAQGLEVLLLDFDPQRGDLAQAQLAAYAGSPVTALVIPQPNFFGVLEDVDGLADWAHANGALAVALVNPLSLGVLKPPGEWGQTGADIACGEGQPLGAPLASGGPYFGFLTARQSFVRQMPGRIVGRTVDLDGKPGYTLTLQAREQHIRRAKATSNICTNQGLLVTAATIFMSLVGAEGLARACGHSVANTRRLRELLAGVPGVTAVFGGDEFHETVIRLPVPAAPVLEKLARRGIFGGFDLARYYPELGHSILVCATETKTQADLERYAAGLAAALS
jgi:glycine dehydrogenase subunit 1